MDPDDLLFQAAAQTIDALSFSQTHVIDRDFRAHSRATIDSVRSLQREQRNRVDDTYGPRNPTVDTVAAQLLASYRGEIGLLELSHEGEESRSLSPSGVVTTPLVMAGMTHSKCLLFKREMKQRIHEWERAFREERGVAVTAHEKGALRQVYELYKTAKNRLRDNSPHSGSEQNPSHTLGFQQRQQGATLYGGCQVEGDAEGEAPGSMGWNSSTVSHYGHIDDHSVSTGMPGSSMAHTSTPRQSQAADEPIETADVSSPTAGKGIPASHMSNEELAVEKRNLKRVLHKFESKFEQRHGYAPTKNDRRSLAREYTRYGELKNEILRRSSGSNAHHDGSDEGSRGMSSNLPGGRVSTLSYQRFASGSQAAVLSQGERVKGDRKSPDILVTSKVPEPAFSMNHSCSGDSPAAPLGKALSANELGHSIGGYAFKWNCTDGTSVGLDRSAFFSLGDYDYPDHHLLRSFCTAPVLPWSTFDCIRRKNVTVSGNHKQDVSADFERLFASANNHNTHQGANCGTTNTSATGQCDIKTSFKSIGALLEDELPELSVDRGGRPHDGTTFLLLAVLAGDMELAHRCLVLGAEANNMAFLSDPNVSVNQMQHGYSPMFIAVIKGHIEMMSLLHQFGGSVQVYDRWGRSPLHAAVALGDTVVVRWLREKGAPRCIGNGSMALQDSPLYSNLAPPNPALEPRPGQTMSLWEGSTASVMDAEGVECTKAVLCHCHSGRPKGYCGCVDDMFLRWSYDRVHSQWQVGINFGKLAALHASRESVNRKVS